MKNLGIIISLLIFWTSCTHQEYAELPDLVKQLENVMVYDTEPSPTNQIHFQRDQTYGNAGDVFIGRLWDVAIDHSGRVYIADSQELNIKVFDSDGRFLATIGRRGQGPGEFQEISSIQTEGKRLYVFDRNQQRIVVFSTDPHEYETTISIASNRGDYEEVSGAYLSRIFVKSNHSFLKSFSSTKMPENINDWEKFGGQNLYYLLDREGEIISDQLLQTQSAYQVLIPFGARRTGMPFEFYGKSLLELSNSDHIFHTWSEDFLVKVYTPEGEYKHAFYYPFEKAILEPGSIFSDAAEGFKQRAVQSMEFPDTWPAIDDLLIDDENRLWVSTIVEDFEVFEWWVLENTGKVITKFDWPRDESIEVVKNGYMYTRQIEEETGLQQVVKYRIAFEEG